MNNVLKLNRNQSFLNDWDNNLIRKDTFKKSKILIMELGQLEVLFAKIFFSLILQNYT